MPELIEHRDAKGRLHREDGPAVEYADGSREWYRHGVPHREDGPAIESPDGTREWWCKGKLHRKDGPAAEWSDGTREWWLDGRRHREDGPALERPDGTRGVHTFELRRAYIGNPSERIRELEAEGWNILHHRERLHGDAWGVRYTLLARDVERHRGHVAGRPSSRPATTTAQASVSLSAAPERLFEPPSAPPTNAVLGQ